MANSNLKPSRTLLRYGGFLASVGTARVLGLLITSVTFPVLVRRLGVETYGLWSYVVALCAFGDVVANPGLTTYTTQQVAARRHEAAGIVPDFLALRLLASIVAAAALLVVAAFEVRADVRSLLRWYGLGALVVSLTGSDFLLTSLELFHARSLLSLIQQAIYAAGVLSLVHSPRDIMWVPASILGSSLLTNVAGWFVLRHNGFRPPLSISPSRWRAMLVPSLHYAATTAMGTVYHRTGQVVVRWFLGDHALGLYAAAVRFVDLLRNLVGLGFSVLMPRMALSAQSAAGMKRLVRAAVSALAAISIPLMLGTLATAHLVVPWLMGGNYAEAVPAVRWMSPFLIAAPLATLLSGTVLYALGRHRACLQAATAGAIVAVVLSLTLVQVFGLTGACIAFVAAEFAVAFTAYCLIPPELRDLWKNPMVAVAAFAAVVMSIAVRLVNSYTSRPLLVVTAGLIVYAIVSALLGRKFLMQQFGNAQ
ncbi:MAG TPA: oligosaccharide flippase family protein [Candidatus Binatia bacterium]|nr:oligosaccharide flippase family protein [Candidatus Binatia bacterium]